MFYIRRDNTLSYSIIFRIKSIKKFWRTKVKRWKKVSENQTNEKEMIGVFVCR